MRPTRKLGDARSATSTLEEASDTLDSVLFRVANAPERLTSGRISFQPGEQLGPYRVGELLGQGGMGLVYRAWDTRLQRTVALKLLRVKDETLQLRLLHEARAAAAIRHPGIGTLYSVEEVDGWAFLTMELVEGESLSHLLRRRRLPMSEVALLARQMAEVLAAAHEAGVVHGDLKPANVMVQPDHRVTLLDFGLAHFTRSSRSGEGGTPWLPTGGTPQYMAPEQEAPGRLEPSADVFSFGLVMLEMLLGQLPPGWREQPWHGNALTSRMRRQLAEVGAPPAFVKVLAGCLWHEPGARYQTGREVLLALDALHEKGVLKRHAPRWLGLGLLLLVTGGASLMREHRLPSAQTRSPPHAQRLTALAADQWHMDVALNPNAEQFAYVGREGLVSLQRVGAAEPFARLSPPAGLRARWVSWDGRGDMLVTLLDVSGHSSIWRLRTPLGSWERVLEEGSSAVASPSGEWLAWLRRDELWASRADGSGARRLAARDTLGRPVPSLRFSPDSTHLAFFRWDESSGRSALVVLPVSGGPEREVLQDWRLSRPGGQGDMAWLRGRLWVSLSEVSPSEAGSNVWQIPISDSGVPQGPLLQRTFWSGQEVMSMTASERTGQLLISLGSIQYRTFVAPLREGPALGSARMLTLSQRSERLSSWSLEGDQLWVTASHQGGFILVGYPMQGGLAQERSASPDWLTYGQPSSDGGLFWWQVSSSNGDLKARLMHQPPGARPARMVLRLPDKVARSPHAPLPLTTSVRCVPVAGIRKEMASCVMAHSGGQSITFHALDTAGNGHGPVLFHLERGRQLLPHQWDLSPDGQRIAHVGLSPQSPGELRALDGRLLARTTHVEGCGGPVSIAWAMDGHALFFTAECHLPPRYVLFHQAPGGKVTELLSSSDTYLRYLAPSPKGGHLAWSSLQLDNDAWLIDLNER